MPTLDISCLENSVDPDQLDSMYPADQGPQFSILLVYMLINGIPYVKRIKNGEDCRT